MTRAAVARATQAPEPNRQVPASSRRLFRSRQLMSWGFIGLFVVWVGLLVVKWPFTQAVVLRSLSGELHESVQVKAFHPTLFPPGYIAEEIRPVHSLQRPTATTVTIRRLVVRANYSDLLLLRKNVEQVFLFGLHLQMPSTPRTVRVQFSSRATPPRFAQIRHVRIEDAVVEFTTSGSPDTPFTVAVKKAELDGVTRTTSASFRAELVTNEPQGVVRTNGQIGPWNWEEAGRTPLTGTFTFDQANLRTLGDMVGVLQAQGRFQGPLAQVTCTGRIVIPQFGTSHGSHTLPLTTKFQATVNGLNADTTLDSVESHLHQTVIHAQGEIKGEERQAGKTAHLRFWVEEGQVEDLLLLFTRHAQASMTGTIRLQAEATLPPGDATFLRRLALRGSFGLDNSRFTKASTQVPLNRLSKTAVGLSSQEAQQDSRVVLSDITGQVSTQNGIATLAHVSFSIPGAHAHLAGTYGLEDQRVQLAGTLRTTGQIAKTTSGWKAAFLKVLSPLLTKHSVTVVPFQINGTAQDAKLALAFGQKRRF